MKTDQQKALDKIKKCLRLAGSNNPNEAAAAMRQAQALMEKFNVDMDDVAASEVSSIGKNATVKTKPTQWESGLATLCSDAFGCRVLFVSFSSVFNAQWRFIGCGSAPELAGYAFEVLLRQLKKDRAAYIRTALKRCGPANKTARADTFCLARIWSVHEKVQALAPNDKTANAIAVYMAKHHPSTSDLKPRINNGKTTSNARWNDMTAGERAGRNANLNRGVDGTAAAPELEHHP